MKKKPIIFGSIIAVMAISIVVAIKSKPEAVETIGGDKNGKRVQVEYIKQDDIEAKISSSGKLEAVNTKTVYLDATNKVVKLHKEVGDSVEKGEMIITMDEEVEVQTQNHIEALEKQLAAEKEALNQILGKGSQSEILNAEASIAALKDNRKATEQSIVDMTNNIDSLKRDVEQQEKDLETAKELLAEGFASQKEVDDLQKAIDDLKQNIEKVESNKVLSEQSLETIDAQIKTAQYNLDLLQNKVTDPTKKASIAAKESSIKNIQNQIEESKNNLNKASTEITAPISGIITYLPEEEGVSVAAGSPLLTIVDPSSLKVECAISPYYAADLRVGLEAEVKYTGSTTVEVKGEVTKVSAIAEVEKTANGETTSIPVEVQINDPGAVIRPGFSVNVKLITDSREDVSLVPILAIEEDDDASYVYIVKEDGTLEKREIEQGLSNGLYVEASNVEAGEMIVSSIEDFIQDGMKVSYEKIGDMQ